MPFKAVELFVNIIFSFYLLRIDVVEKYVSNNLFLSMLLINTFFSKSLMKIVQYKTIYNIIKQLYVFLCSSMHT